MTRLLWERLAPYRGSLVIIFALLLVQAITNLSLPTINGDIITNGVATGDVHYIERMGGYMLLLSAVLVVATIVGVYFGSRTAMAFGRDVRALLFRKVEDFSLAELNHFGTASLITRNTNDVYQVQQVVLMLLNRRPGGALHGDRRHHHGAAPERAALGRDRGRDRGHGRLPRRPRAARPAAVPFDAGQDRQGQPGRRAKYYRACA